MVKGLTLLYQKSNYQVGIKQFERAVRDYPEYYEAYTQIGIAYLHMGNTASAEIALRKAVELSREQYSDASAWLATLLNDKRRFVEAEPLARKALELDPNSWHANAELARSLLGLITPPKPKKAPWPHRNWNRTMHRFTLSCECAQPARKRPRPAGRSETITSGLLRRDPWPTRPVLTKTTRRRAERCAANFALTSQGPHPAEAIKDRTADKLGVAVSNLMIHRP